MRARKNTRGSRVEIWPRFSADAMHELKKAARVFDLVYIDGSHHRLEVMDDAVAAWRCLDDEGCIIFDDYEWDLEDESTMKHPRVAIDSFVELVKPQGVVVYKGYQLIVKKDSGGLRHHVQHPASQPFIIAMVTDDAYACATAVAVRSAIGHCSEPRMLVFVVVDEGLSTQWRADLERVALDASSKLVFVAGPRSCQPTWSRIYLDQLIPTDATILYLDVDVLCRRDLLELRDRYAALTTFAAVVDFGIRGEFNAGVMLLNLGRMRHDFGPTLRARASEFENDQALLNSVVDCWTPLPPQWNAQGLGTYARFRTRSELDFPRLFTESEFESIEKDPYIVHFTGSPRFSIDQRAKYAPSPVKPWVPGCSNPYKREWFEVKQHGFNLPLPVSTPVTDAVKEALEIVASATTVEDNNDGCPIPILESEKQLLVQARALVNSQFHQTCLHSHDVGVVLPLRCTEECPPRIWTEHLTRCFAGALSRVKLYIGVDYDDVLWERSHEASTRSRLAGIVSLSVHKFPPTKPAAICAIWASLAREAVDDGCSYVFLWGDDVSIVPDGTLLLEVERELPPDGVGVVAPLDAVDSSVPTFPIFTKRHLELFNWPFPIEFVNQDADPYIFELYRRVGRATILTGVTVVNKRGGPVSCLSCNPCSPPLYDRQPLPEWKNKFLEPNAAVLAKKLDAGVVTIDVVIPTVRTPIDLIKQALSCPVPPNADIKFIVIVDTPSASNIDELRLLQGPNCRVRVNKTNIGAPMSRNRGLEEACAEWVLFLDDDAALTEECLRAYVDRLARDDEDTRVAGLVGTVELPLTDNILHEGTRMSDITFFFNLPSWMGDEVPWGVTANLLVKRSAAITFDPVFAKSGGGEDVDFCIRQTKKMGLPLGRVADAVVVHEWWPAETTPAYVSHFWNWTTGDGYLLYRHSEFVYLNFPNVIEYSLALFILFPWFPASCLKYLVAVWLVEFVCETTRALRGPESTHLSKSRRLAAAVVSVAIKNVVDAGHAAVSRPSG
ncbi:hypothetical protein CTAYLR_008950 [Chrysophaeum taylorii]|uniref:Glycosyltransferase 2-like domain-containing protein n=1 Tax=Chrysophaeum taylorii TaxID=2483200 RepID=A0AAD7XPW9_9STRA|nr:hypothetical protein CTAYLR_008950 [Chrysophaeum taylorii]